MAMRKHPYNLRSEPKSNPRYNIDEPQISNNQLVCDNINTHTEVITPESNLTYTISSSISDVSFHQIFDSQESESNLEMSTHTNTGNPCDLGKRNTMDPMETIQKLLFDMNISINNHLDEQTRR